MDSDSYFQYKSMLAGYQRALGTHSSPESPGEDWPYCRWSGIFWHLCHVHGFVSFCAILDDNSCFPSVGEVLERFTESHRAAHETLSDFPFYVDTATICRPIRMD